MYTLVDKGVIIFIRILPFFEKLVKWFKRVLFRPLIVILPFQQFIPILTYFHRILLYQLLTAIFNFFHNLVGTDVFRRVELGLHFSKFLSFSRSPNILPLLPRHILHLSLQKVKIFQTFGYPGSGRTFIIIINLRIPIFRQHLKTFITSNLLHT